MANGDVAPLTGTDVIPQPQVDAPGFTATTIPTTNIPGTTAAKTTPGTATTTTYPTIPTKVVKAGTEPTTAGETPTDDGIVAATPVKFTDKNGDNLDDETGEPETAAVSELPAPTPEEQAERDIEITKDGPPVAPKAPTRPIPETGTPPVGREPTQAEIDAQDRADKAAGWPEKQKNYEKDKAAYDQSKAIYDAAFQRIQDAMRLNESQKGALANGQTVTIDDNKARYIKAALAAANPGDDASALIRYTKNNPELRPSMSSGIYIMSSRQVQTGKNGPKGSLQNLPKGLRTTLRTPIDKEDWRSSTSGLGNTQRNIKYGTDIPDLKLYEDLADLLGSTDPRYRTSSDVDQEMTFRASEIAGAMNDVRNAGANLGTKFEDSVKPRERTEADMERTITKMLTIAADDEQATTLAIAGHPEVVQNLGLHDWGDAATTTDSKGTHSANPKHPFVRILKSVASDPANPANQRAASTIAVTLSTDEDFLKLGQRSPGITNAFVSSLAPYQADLAGYDSLKDLPPLSDGGPTSDDKPGVRARARYTQLLRVLCSDAGAAVRTTNSIKVAQRSMAILYGKGDHDTSLARVSGVMNATLSEAVKQNLDESVTQDQLSAAINASQKSNAWDSGFDVGTTLIGLIPGGGLAATTLREGVGLGLGAANPFVKSAALDSAEAPSEATTAAKSIEDFVKSNKFAAEDFDRFLLNGAIQKGLLDRDSRTRAQLAPLLKDGQIMSYEEYVRTLPADQQEHEHLRAIKSGDYPDILLESAARSGVKQATDANGSPIEDWDFARAFKDAEGVDYLNQHTPRPPKK